MCAAHRILTVQRKNTSIWFVLLQYKKRFGHNQHTGLDTSSTRAAQRPHRGDRGFAEDFCTVFAEIAKQHTIWDPVCNVNN
jgi:hypothetical protein